MDQVHEGVLGSCPQGWSMDQVHEGVHGIGSTGVVHGPGVHVLYTSGCGHNSSPTLFCAGDSIELLVNRYNINKALYFHLLEPTAGKPSESSVFGNCAQFKRFIA